MKLKTIIIIVIVVALLVTIKLLFLMPPEVDPAKDAMMKAAAVNVTGFVVHAQQLETKLFSSGTVHANEEVELHPEVSGKLVSILFTEGTNVAKGALLAKINDVDLQAQLKKLSLQSKLAKEKEGRLKALLAINGISQEEYDAASNESQTIAADMEYTNAQIAKTEIHAPFSGKIGLKNISEGSFVSSASVIATMQQTDLLKIDFTIPEKYASVLTTGDTVHFNVDNQKEQFKAKISAIEPKIDMQTRNITVRALFNNSAMKVFPGSFAKIELVISKKQSSFMIPTEAIIPELKGKKVFIGKSGKAMPVKVETGIRTDANVEIISGLSEGDTVIITGIMSMKPNSNIKITGLKK